MLHRHGKLFSWNLGLKPLILCWLARVVNLRMTGGCLMFAQALVWTAETDWNAHFIYSITWEQKSRIVKCPSPLCSKKDAAEKGPIATDFPWLRLRLTGRS